MEVPQSQSQAPTPAPGANDASVLNRIAAAGLRGQSQTSGTAHNGQEGAHTPVQGSAQPQAQGQGQGPSHSDPNVGANDEMDQTE